MNEQTLVNLLTTKRKAERLAKPFQEETSAKHVLIPTHAWESFLEAAQQVLLEEIDKK